MFIWGLTRGRVKYRKSIHTIVDTGVKIYFTCLAFSLHTDIQYDKLLYYGFSYLSTSLEYSLITFHSTKVLQNMNFVEGVFK